MTIRRPYLGKHRITDGGEFGAPRENAWGKHLGTDYNLVFEPVLAVDEGDVIAPTGVGVGTYGNYVRLLHPDGRMSGYAHLDQLSVVQGGKVMKGEVIGKSGNTGLSTGPHLHVEYFIDGQQVGIELYYEEVAVPEPTPVDNARVALDILWGHLDEVESIALWLKRVAHEDQGEALELLGLDMRSHIPTIKTALGLGAPGVEHEEGTERGGETDRPVVGARQPRDRPHVWE